MMLKFIALNRLKSTNLNLQSFKSTPPEYVKIKIVCTARKHGYIFGYIF